MYCIRNNNLDWGLLRHRLSNQRLCVRMRDLAPAPHATGHKLLYGLFKNNLSPAPNVHLMQRFNKRPLMLGAAPLRHAPAVRTDGVSEQYASEVADLALGVRPGGRLGHQPQQPHLHVSLASTCRYLFMPSAWTLKTLCEFTRLPRGHSQMSFCFQAKNFSFLPDVIKVLPQLFTVG